MSFVDLLHRAEGLGSRVASEKANSAGGDLKSIFFASDDICKRRQLRTDQAWQEPSASKKEKPTVSIMKATVPANPEATALVDEYMRKSVERARVEAERAFINQHILDESRSEKTAGSTGKQLAKSGLSGQISTQAVEHQQSIYAKKLAALLEKDLASSIRPAVMESVEAIREHDVARIWEQVMPLMSTKDKPNNSTFVYRTSELWVKHVLQRSTAYLQIQYREHLESTVENNRAIARRGGLPGTLPLIEAYLNVVLPTDYQYQDGNCGKHPVWPIVFNCIRLGDIDTAKKVSRSLQSIPNCSVLVSCINTWSDEGLDRDRRLKLNAEWKHEMSLCTDPYKCACYALFLGFDCNEVADSIENWLWLKLMACKLDTANGRTLFHKLQTQVCVDCGEEYFVQGSGNYLIYFTALWMTGQIERAIDVLYRAGLDLHGVHIAILAYQEKLLLLTEKVSDPMLCVDRHDPVICRFNYARFVLLYVKQFELINAEYALNYCFFLKDLTFERDGQSERSIFDVCVSRLCFITHETDLILGKLMNDGEVEPGLINRFKAALNINDVISRVAADTDIDGQVLAACKLYLLIGKTDEAFNTCSKRLANFMASPPPLEGKLAKEAQETVDLACWLQQLYERKPCAELTTSTKMELDTLLKLNTVHSLAESSPAEALRLLTELKLLPANMEEIPARTADYVLMADQIKSVLHHVVLDLIRICVRLSKAGLGPARADLKQLVKVVLLFIAEVNCRMPVHYNTQILHLQSQI